jgi:hypothetical protein
VIEHAFAPLGQPRDPTEEITVQCRWCRQHPTLAVLQWHEDGWRPYGPLRLTPRTAEELGEPRANLVPLVGFDGPNDLGRRRGVTLRCRPRCRRPVRHVSLRRLYGLADAARAAGESVVYD